MNVHRSLTIPHCILIDGIMASNPNHQGVAAETNENNQLDLDVVSYTISLFRRAKADMMAQRIPVPIQHSETAMESRE